MDKKQEEDNIFSGIKVINHNEIVNALKDRQTTARIIKKTEDHLHISWKDSELGYGEMNLKWDSILQVTILDSEALGFDSIIRIIQALPKP